jgi:hypothetical protein
MSLLELQKELKKFNQAAKLTGAVQDVDKLIDVLVSAREEVAGGIRFLYRPFTLIYRH